MFGGGVCCFLLPKFWKSCGLQCVRGTSEASTMSAARDTGICTNKPRQKQHSMQKEASKLTVPTPHKLILFWSKAVLCFPLTDGVRCALRPRSCNIRRFFKKKLGYIPEHDADLPYVRPDFQVPTACLHWKASLVPLLHNAAAAAAGFPAVACCC